MTKFVEFTINGKKFRAYNEGHGMVSIERYQGDRRREVAMPTDQQLEAARKALNIEPEK